MASVNYYNVTDLDQNLKVFSKVFNNKPIRYVVYTDRIFNPTRISASLRPCNKIKTNYRIYYSIQIFKTKSATLMADDLKYNVDNRSSCFKCGNI